MTVIEREMRELEQQVKQLKEDVASLQQNLFQAAREAEGDLQQILLGQAAFAFADLIERHIYGPGGAPYSWGAPPSLTKLAKRAQQMVLNEDQLIRWTAAQEHLSHSMPFEELLAADCFLRKLTVGYVHGTDLRLQSRTLQDLKKWAGIHGGPKAIVPVWKYLELLSHFSTGDHPLAPNISLAEVLHRATTSIG